MRALGVNKFASMLKLSKAPLPRCILRLPPRNCGTAMYADKGLGQLVLLLHESCHSCSLLGILGRSPRGNSLEKLFEIHQEKRGKYGKVGHELQGVNVTIPFRICFSPSVSLKEARSTSNAWLSKTCQVVTSCHASKDVTEARPSIQSCKHVKNKTHWDVLMSTYVNNVR